MRRLSLLIIAILVLPSLAAALQDPYIVYGYVRYPDGSPAAQLPVDVHTPSQIKNTPVSYTHLTLPTILRV